jgi:hypothetical protein
MIAIFALTQHPVLALLARYQAIAYSVWQHRTKLAKLDAKAAEINTVQTSIHNLSRMARLGSHPVFCLFDLQSEFIHSVSPHRAPLNGV